MGNLTRASPTEEKIKTKKKLSIEENISGPTASGVWAGWASISDYRQLKHMMAAFILLSKLLA